MTQRKVTGAQIDMAIDELNDVSTDNPIQDEVLSYDTILGWTNKPVIATPGQSMQIFTAVTPAVRVFDNSVSYLWTVTAPFGYTQPSHMSYDSGVQEFTLVQSGTYTIDVHVKLAAVSSWATENSTFGTQLNATTNCTAVGPDFSIHHRQLPGAFDFRTNTSSWIDQYIITGATDSTFQLGIFLGSYNNAAVQANVSAAFRIQRIGEEILFG